MSEKQLIRKCVAGDQQACAEFYQTYQPNVLRLANRILKDPALAEDIAQVSMAKAFRALGTFNGTAKLTTWLHRIAFNEACQLLRQSSKMPMVSITGIMRDDEDKLEFSGDVDLRFIDNHLSNVTERVTINRALKGLPSFLRTPFLLHYVDGYTHQEAADATGVPVTTSKNRATRAMNILRARLAR